MADNLFLLATKQIRQNDLSGYILGVFQNNFTGILTTYYQTSGYFGNYIVYTSGGNQTIYGTKSFFTNPNVPYSGTSGSAISQQFVVDQIAGIQSQINGLNLYSNAVAHLSGIERFSGYKYFEQLVLNSGQVTGELMVPLPVNSGDAVPLIYLQTQLSSLLGSNLLNTTGNQTASGIISFFNGGTVYVPIAIDPSGAIPLTQLDVTGNNILNLLSITGSNLQTQIDNLDLAAAAAVTGFGGVLSFNAQSGNLFSQGRGTVTCTQNGNVLNVSGHTLDGYTGAFFGYSQIDSGVNTQFIYYPQVFSVSPYVFPQLINSSGDPFLSYYVSGLTTSGFNLVFSNTVSSSGYGISYFGWTGTSGSIINVVQGPQGAPSLIPITPLNFTTYFNGLATTGSGLYEWPFPQNFNLTGIKLGCRVTGSGSWYSGKLYSIDQSNVQTNLTGITLNSGQFSSQVSCVNNPILVASSNRLGVDILSISSGISNVSIGFFGYGI
jgi:hypothetical protein